MTSIGPLVPAPRAISGQADYSPNFTIEKLLRTKAYIDSLPDAPIAMWFVDRYFIYYEFLREIDYTSPVGYSAWGMPVYASTSSQIRESILAYIKEGHTLEQARKLWPVCQPGVWSIMRKGGAIRIANQLDTPPSLGV